MPWGSIVTESKLSAEWPVEKSPGNMDGTVAQMIRKIERKEGRERSHLAPQPEATQTYVLYEAIEVKAAGLAAPEISTTQQQQCWQQPAAAGQLLSCVCCFGLVGGKKMEQFDVLQTLGKGSFGVVRKVRRKADGKTLVVKEMDYGAADEKQKEQIVAEVNILRELRHPFIVRYYDRIVDRRRTRLHIVMEHCSTDLARVIKTSRLRGEYLDESFLWNLMCQVVVALEVCHSRVGKGGARKPIIHRDLKPDNVFLTSDNVVKLGDFGLAKELSGAQLAETSVGTPYYMSPELINEQRYDERTDVWSLGCLMYEAAALARPFNAQNQLALAMKINTGKVAPIPSRYSPGLFATIQWMLNKTRHKRPRIGDLVKAPGLQLPLRENRLLVQEFQLEQSYLRRLRTLKSREMEIERREAELAAEESKLRRRSEQALAALAAQREKRETEKEEKRQHRGGGGGGVCCYCAPPSALSVGGGGQPSPPVPSTSRPQRHRQQEQQAPPPLPAPTSVPFMGREPSSSSSSLSPSPSSSSPMVSSSVEAFGGKEAERVTPATAVVVDGAVRGRSAPRRPARKTAPEGREQREQELHDVTLVHTMGKPVGGSGGRAASQERACSGVWGGGRGAVMSNGPHHGSPSNSDTSEPPQDVSAADATTAVLDYASLVLHSSPAARRRGSASKSDDGARQETTATAATSPPRQSSCLDDTVPMDSHDAVIMPTRPVARKQQHEHRYPYRSDRAGSSSPAGGGSDGGGGGVGKGGWRRARGDWEDGGEFRSTKTEAVMAAGRRARESYAGFMETIAAARDLGTWAAPTACPAQEHNKENAYATATSTAVPYGGRNTPPVPRYMPLVELPNGHCTRPQSTDALYPTPPPAAVCNPSAGCHPASADAAAWRGRGGGGKDAVRVGGQSPSSRRPEYYQRSASDVVSAACGGGGYSAEAVTARRARGGVGGRGSGAGGGPRRRGSFGAVISSAVDEMHLTAMAMGRARRGRLSSRF
eukprot:g18898.t1